MEETYTLTHEECMRQGAKLWTEIPNEEIVLFHNMQDQEAGRSFTNENVKEARSCERLTCVICTWTKLFHQNNVKSFSLRSIQKSCARSLTQPKRKANIMVAVIILCVIACCFLMGSKIFTARWWQTQTSAANVLKINSDLDLLNKALKQKHKNNPYISRKSSLGNPFNPEVWDNRTSNTRKHFVILYWSKIRGHTARIQTKEEYERNQHVWPYTYVGDNCPVSCDLTNNRSRAKEADAFVVHSRLTDVWDVPPFEYLAPWILQNNENPVYTAAMSDAKIMNKFNLLISYRLDSDFPSPIYPMPSLSEPIPFEQRLGNVLAVFSKCELVRTEYMRQLMKFIDVHSYGACLKNRQGLIGLYGQANGKYVFKDYKLVLTRFYKFSLVFMNQDCDYFVDDRLYHALESGSVPVYMGTNKVDEFLPSNLRNSIIRVADFDSPESLAKYLHYLSNNETAYSRYLLWKTKGLGETHNSTIGRWWKPKYPLFCQVCMKLAQGNLHSGLDVDVCKPRTYLDWKLQPPYSAEQRLQHAELKVTCGWQRIAGMLIWIFIIMVCYGLLKARRPVDRRHT